MILYFFTAGTWDWWGRSYIPHISKLVTKLTKRREMLFILRDIGVYCLFLVILSVLVSGKTDPNAFLLQSHMKNAFIKIGHREYDFSSKVSNV